MQKPITQTQVRAAVRACVEEVTEYLLDVDTIAYYIGHELDEDDETAVATFLRGKKGRLRRALRAVML